MAQTVLATMLKLLAFAFEPPAERLATSVVSGELARDFRQTWADAELEDGSCAALCDALDEYRGGASMSQGATDAVLHELRREHTRLFLGKRPLVENSEGPWRKKSEGFAEVALMANSYSTEVSDFMRFCGVVRPRGYNDCMDYIENELDFAALLASQPDYLVERGIDPLERLDAFIGEHLQKWVPGFCGQVAAQTELAYYRELAGTTAALVREL
jgi:TorA maturation chaperone TorD